MTASRSGAASPARQPGRQRRGKQPEADREVHGQEVRDEAADQLAAIVAVIDSGEIEATTAERAYLAGALDVLRARM